MRVDFFRTFPHKARTALKSERGDYMFIFAIFTMTILMFIGMTVDFSQMYVKRLRLEEVGQVLREVRFETQPIYSESTTPEKTLEDILKKYAVMNGLREDQVSVTLSETLTLSGSGGMYGSGGGGWPSGSGGSSGTKTCTRRDGTIVITLKDTYDGIFLPLFGIDTVELAPIVINGSYYISNSGGTWYPALGDKK